MGLHDFGGNCDSIEQFVATSLVTESCIDARLMKRIVIPTFTGCVAVERHGQMQNTFSSYSETPRSNPGLELGYPSWVFW
jgi:hypothetical protein